jgi:hypothetical protein
MTTTTLAAALAVAANIPSTVAPFVHDALPITVGAYSGANNAGYLPPLHCITTGSALTMNTQREYWTPIEWPAGGPLLGLGCYVITAQAASTIVAAIYRRTTTTWAIVTQLARVTFNSATTGFKTSTFTSVPIEYGAPLWAFLYCDTASVQVQTGQLYRGGPHNTQGYCGVYYSRDSIVLASAAPSTGPAATLMTPQNSTASVTIPLLGVA